MGESDGRPVQQLFWNQQEVWSGRGDLNARPSAPKLDGFPLYHSPVPKTFNNLGRLLSLSRHPFAYQHDQ